MAQPSACLLLLSRPEGCSSQTLSSPRSSPRTPPLRAQNRWVLRSLHSFITSRFQERGVWLCDWRERGGRAPGSEPGGARSPRACIPHLPGEKEISGHERGAVREARAGAVTLPRRGLQGGAPVLRAGEGEGWRRAFSWCPAASGWGSSPSPQRRRQRGGLLGASRAGGPLTKRGSGRAEPAPRAGAPPTADPHGCQRGFLRLIPTSMKTAQGGRQQALCPGPSRDSCSRDPSPLLCLLPAPLPPSPPQLLGRPAAFQGFCLRPWDAQRGAAPLIWGRERRRINSRVCWEE